MPHCSSEHEEEQFESMVGGGKHKWKSKEKSGKKANKKKKERERRIKIINENLNLGEEGNLSEFENGMESDSENKFENGNGSSGGPSPSLSRKQQKLSQSLLTQYLREVPDTGYNGDIEEIEQVYEKYIEKRDRDSSNWKTNLSQALEEQENEAEEKGEYSKSRGFFGRGILILASEHQEQTNQEIGREYSSEPIKQNRFFLAADAEKRSLNDTDINSTSISDGDIELLMNYLILLARFPKDMPLPSKEDVDKIRGYYLFIPVQSGIKLIDLDTILPVIGSYGQDTISQTLIEARRFGASLSAIKNKEMFIVKKDNNIFGQIIDELSIKNFSITNLIQQIYYNSPHTRRLILKLIHYYIWYKCPSEMLRGQALITYDNKINELYNILDEIFKELQPFECGKILFIIMKELGKGLISKVQSCNYFFVFKKIEYICEIIIQELNKLEASVINKLKINKHFMNKLTDLQNIRDIAATQAAAAAPPAATGAAAPPAAPPAATGAAATGAAAPPAAPPAATGPAATGAAAPPAAPPAATGAAAPPAATGAAAATGASAMNLNHTLSGGASKRTAKKYSKKVKSKMLKGKSKKHLKKAKKSKKTGKKVTFHSSSKKSKKNTRKRR